MQEFTKTIKLKLYTNSEQFLLIQNMTEQYRLACNFVSEYIFNNNFELNSNKLNKVLYYDTKNRFGLKSQLTQSVFRTVTARYKAVEQQLFKSPYKYKDENNRWQYIKKTLDWLQKPIYFKTPQADLVRSRDYSFVSKGTILSINTLNKRIKVNFNSSVFNKYLDGTWSLGTAKLICKNKIWYICIPVTKFLESFSKDNVKHVVGIDRGLRFLAVTYDEQGKVTFYSGKDIIKKRQKFLRIRSNLQSKGTKSAKRRLKKLSKRENRWMSDINHQITKTLVDKYGPNTLYVLEDLTGVSFNQNNLSSNKTQNYNLTSWAFYQFEEFLTYKAHENCSEVIKVSARYTSQRCPKCGSINKNNRHHNTHEYICSCGYRSNDDRIGAMNIQLLGTFWVSGENTPRFENSNS